MKYTAFRVAFIVDGRTRYTGESYDIEKARKAARSYRQWCRVVTIQGRASGVRSDSWHHVE